MQKIALRPPVESECAVLSALCLRSKAVWGYDDAFLERCREELSIRSTDLLTGMLRVAEVDGEIAGVVQMTLDGGEVHLDKLFIDPAFLRHGVGRVLMEWATTKAREIGANQIIIDSDPDAAVSIAGWEPLKSARRHRARFPAVSCHALR